MGRRRGPPPPPPPTVPAWQSRRASDSVLVGEGEQPGMARLYPFRWVGEVPLFALNLAD